ncbi:glycosyltransferase [Belliella baltica DSM 15883]|uniref:Glycosyltransferase n=1 Tax=Belliella baltica (strain DSM 15883 / CIP 108006 / LMG 21964 / BA134) TaxID=866536 RepID=I3Z7X4_BELBD|nr:glycosyltransferase [Belliella baltica]AFL85342.1 glycosyltransferase [Belliella baltica DSM 15883]
MEKPKIAIASVLKPLQDARAFYRLGLSLRETNKYHLNIIGFSLKNPRLEEDISYFKLFDQERSTWKRFFVNIKFLGILKFIEPKVLIVTTYELLPAAVLMKFFYKYKLIYDLQENYILNVKQNKTLPKWKQILAVLWIGLIEKSSKPFVDHYIFAEACYKEEFPSITDFTVLENKFFDEIKSVSPVKFEPNQKIIFLISGTLTEVYGVVEAIKWFVEILKVYSNFQLKIVGHYPIPSYGKELKELASTVPQICLEVSENPMDYQQILEAYKTCDIVLLPYYQLSSISPKIPSKMYECLALGKPYIYTPNKNWKRMADRYQSGLGFEFRDVENAVLNLDDFLKQTFYSERPGDEVKFDRKSFIRLIEDQF